MHAERAPLDRDAFQALSALCADLDAIRLAMPRAAGACYHATSAFASAFHDPTAERWSHAATVSALVLRRSVGVEVAEAAAARRRLAAFVAENPDLLGPHE